MNPEQPLLDSMRKAVEAMPDDVPLRVHLATMLMGAGLRDEAIRQVGAILQREPGNTVALALLQAPTPAAGPPAPAPPGEFDWSRAESEVQDLLPPMFVGDAGAADSEDPAARAFDAEPAGVLLADVAGMA